MVGEPQAAGAAGTTTSGASSAPTGGSGASPTPQPASPGAASPSATTKKIDFGMAPKGASSEPATTDAELYNDAWWKQHGEAIFKHDRFKELNEYKKKYTDVEPIAQFAEKFGGYDQLQMFGQYLGPVWQHLMGLGENANQVWSQLLPVFNALLSGQPLPIGVQKALAEPSQPTGASDEDDPFEQKLKPIAEQVETLNKKLTEKEQQEKQEKQARKEWVKQRQTDNLRQYEQLLEKKMANTEKPIPEVFKDVIGQMLVKHLGSFMPKGQDGKLLNPLNHYSEEAFTTAWEKIVEPKLRAMQGAILEWAKTTTDQSSPTVPNTHANGSAPVGNRAPSSRADKAARMAQYLQNGR